MRVTLNIKDDKAPFIMEILNSLKHVKVEPELSEKEYAIKSIKGAAKDLKLYKQGKLKLKSWEEFLDEL